MREVIAIAVIALALAASMRACAAEHLVFIDHFNLRRTWKCNDADLARQTAEIKVNLDNAKKYGVGTYILFTRSFEYLVDYDFEVDGLGDLSGVVHPPGGEHRAKQEQYAKCFREVFDHAEKLGVKVIMHTNQFEFPDSLYKLAGDKMAGSAPVCPGKPLAFDLLRAKIREFFTRFPKCAGLQLTLSETQARITDCKCPACEKISDGDRFLKVADAAIEVCRPLGKSVMIRTWGHFEQPEIVARLPKEIVCSTKFTLPDFHLNNYPNPVMGQQGERQEVEFDGWGEYSGWNYFPCYYGDIFAPRVKECQAKGVPSLGIRLNWDPGMAHIFSKPYGNEANIAVFVGLARDPNADPDALLRDYIAKVFPESAREAAFKLYKRSTAIQTACLTWRGENANDHSRVWLGGIWRVRTQIGKAVPETYEATRQELDAWRQRIDAAYEEAISLIEALGPDVSAEWTADLRHGARTMWQIAQSNADSIELYAAHRERDQGRPMPDISALADRLRDRSRLWEKTDLDYYNLMYGRGLVELLDEVMGG